MKSTGPDAATVYLVWDRDGGCCACCGRTLSAGWRGLDWSVQHRVPRGRGGTNNPANLILLCGSATTGCHGDAESQRTVAYRRGYLVETGADPALVPVWYPDGRWLLTPEGGRKRPRSPYDTVDEHVALHAARLASPARYPERRPSEGN